MSSKRLVVKSDDANFSGSSKRRYWDDLLRMGAKARM